MLRLLSSITTTTTIAISNFQIPSSISMHRSASAAMRTTSLAVVLVAAAICAAPTPTAAVSGGWSPIPDVDDPHIQELGRWAVAEHDRKLNDGLEFNRVVGGEAMSAAGVKYRLVIDASNPDDKYEAVLTERAWANKRILFSFNPADD